MILVLLSGLVEKMRDNWLRVEIRQRIWDKAVDGRSPSTYCNNSEGCHFKLFIDGVTMKHVDEILFGDPDIPDAWMFKYWFRNMPIEQLYAWWLIAEEAKRLDRMARPISNVVGTLSQADNLRHRFKRMRDGNGWLWNYGGGG